MSNIYDYEGNVIATGSTVEASVFIPDESLCQYDKICRSINHRGYRADGARENTIAAYRASKNHGFYYVETDVQYTQDNVAILQHNDYITYNGVNTSVQSLTYAQMQTVYADLATFEEFISLCRKIGLHPYIELKTSQTTAQVNALVDIVRKYRMEHKCTWIGNYANISKVQVYDNSARLGILNASLDQTLITQAATLKTDTNEVFLDTWINSTISDVITMAKAANLPLELYTFVNSTTEIENLDPYITGFTADTLIAGKVLYDANIA